MANGEVRGTSTIRFRRGDTFKGRLTPRNGVTIAAYGTGGRPVLTCFEDLSSAAIWSLHAAGVWKATLTTTNVGFLKADDTHHAVKRSALAALAGDWDFYDDGAATLYVKSTTNPATRASTLLAAPRNLNVIAANDSVTVTGIEVRGNGGHGISGRARRFTVTDCKISDVGGSYLPGFADGTTRYGNGIEAGPGSFDWLVQSNEISDAYDAGFTAQGTGDATNSAFSNLLVLGNHIHHCTQSLEFWSAGVGTGFVGVKVLGNLCEAAGGSWATEVRPNQDNAVHLLTYDWVLPADIEITGNVFSGAVSAYRYSTSATPGLSSHDNDIRLAAGTLIEHGQTDTIEGAAAWAASRSTEPGSHFTVL